MGVLLETLLGRLGNWWSWLSVVATVMAYDAGELRVIISTRRALRDKEFDAPSTLSSACQS